MKEEILKFKQGIELRKEIPFKVGDTIRVWQKVKEKDKIKIHPFLGIVIAIKSPKKISGTFIVRGEIDGIGVERIFPLHSPTIEKIEIIKRGKVRRAKLYFLRRQKKKIKRKEGE
ncbi:MAG: 50S ribosomal protein L19 [Minisyncoccales bacterium]